MSSEEIFGFSDPVPDSFTLIAVVLFLGLLSLKAVYSARVVLKNLHLCTRYWFQNHTNIMMCVLCAPWSSTEIQSSWDAKGGMAWWRSGFRKGNRGELVWSGLKHWSWSWCHWPTCPCWFCCRAAEGSLPWCWRSFLVKRPPLKETPSSPWQPRLAWRPCLLMWHWSQISFSSLDYCLCLLEASCLFSTQTWSADGVTHTST